jgi:hypothetical protein
MPLSAEAQIAIDNLHLTGPEPPQTLPEPPQTPSDAAAEPPRPLPSTLGQTPHEPTVRPWELELLISGALVFSIMQLPAQVDGWYQALDPRLDAGWHMAAFMGWFYVKLALYALVGGFVLHLAVRGYWVGVIGIEAVFPHGIRWDRMRSGPIFRQLQRERTPPLQTLIDGADRVASMIFGAAFAVAMLFGYSLIIGALMVGLVSVTRLAVPGSVASSLVMNAAFVLLLAPIIVAGLVDRRMGDRLDPDGRAARIIRRVGRAYNRMQASALFMPLLFILITNLRQRRRGLLALVGVPVLFIAFFIVKDVLVGRGMVHADGYAYLPGDAGALAVEPGFYADQRSGAPGDEKLPEIQSDMVRDPYVRLFIPYLPRRHNTLIARRCPGVRPGAAHTGAGGEAVLRCLASLQPLTLNGKPYAASFRFSTQPQTGFRGIVAYIPTAGLPRGENVLTVAQLAIPDATPAEAAKLATPHSIPFWL